MFYRNVPHRGGNPVINQVRRGGIQALRGKQSSARTTAAPRKESVATQQNRRTCTAETEPPLWNRAFTGSQAVSSVFLRNFNARPTRLTTPSLGTTVPGPLPTGSHCRSEIPPRWASLGTRATVPTPAEGLPRSISVATEIDFGGRFLHRLFRKAIQVFVQNKVQNVAFYTGFIAKLFKYTVKTRFKKR